MGSLTFISMAQLTARDTLITVASLATLDVHKPAHHGIEEKPIGRRYRSTPSYDGRHSDEPALRDAGYGIAFTASTRCLAEIPKASTSSSGLPECGISRTASSCDLAGATPACARADRTASPIPPSAQ
jgi:hypothetical protein